ncbi:MAG: hypothetical protein KQA35_04480 [Candidatus Aenigmarchaeota archaeon]|nr:hypothetical protein [Candidatus Aenigmarchaeota archaeon]
MYVFGRNSTNKTLQELVEEYYQTHGNNSERGHMLNGGIDGLMRYLADNGYHNANTVEIYECLKNCESKNHSTRG